MKFFITGSRSFNDFDFFSEKIKKYKDVIDIITIEGNKDIDSFCIDWGKENGIPILIQHPKWHTKEGYDKGAGLRKTNEVIDKVDAVLVFWNGESKGAEIVIERSRKLNKKIKVFEFSDPMAGYFVFSNKSSFLHYDFSCEVIDLKGNLYTSANEAYRANEDKVLDKDRLLFNINKQKFLQNKKLKEKLKNLGDKKIIFDSRDIHWGINFSEDGLLDIERTDKNIFGQILTNIKNKL